MRNLIGQQHAIDLLTRQLASGRLHHAYIFHGPAGVGKMTAALAFAGAYLCHQPDNAQPCTICPSCNHLGENLLNASGLDQITEDTTELDLGAIGGGHPDLHIITKELARYADDADIRKRKLTQIPTEILREQLIEPAYHAPVLSGRKVFIVDEAELLNITGQNTLLKTLEEPPAGTMIILVTSSEDRLLPTIRSRCQRIGFIPLDDQHVRDFLTRRAQDLSADDTVRLVALADGSLGRAHIALTFNLIEPALIVERGLKEIENGRPQPELGAEIHQTIDTFAAAWVEKHAGASKEAANRLGLSLMVALISGIARRRLTTLAPTLDPDTPETSDQVMAGPLGTIDAVERWQHLVRTNVNLSLACDHLVASIERAALS
ncbi:MAG: DNA polymerase III subunit [Phycisphaeraceae bacterium]